MIKRYDEINELFINDYYSAAKREEDELVKFIFYWKSLENLYAKYASSTSGDRKMLQDYLNHDDIMAMLYEKIDLNDKDIDVFLKEPVFDLTFNPGKSKDYYLNKRLGDNWGAIRNETDKSIRNFQIIYSITGMTNEEKDFDEVMLSLFTTMYKVYNNVSHSYFGVIDETTAEFVYSSAHILEKVMPALIDLRNEFGV